MKFVPDFDREPEMLEDGKCLVPVIGEDGNKTEFVMSLDDFESFLMDKVMDLSMDCGGRVH